MHGADIFHGSGQVPDKKLGIPDQCMGLDGGDGKIAESGADKA